MTATVLSLHFFFASLAINSSTFTSEAFSITSFRTQIGIVIHKYLFHFNHKRGKAKSEFTSLLLETGRETKNVLFSALSAASKPVHSPCRSPTFWYENKSTAVSSPYKHLHVPHVLLQFWNPQSFNCFLAFQWLCSVIQWMQTKMSGCYLQLTLVTNPSPETHELLGSGG